jgi:hypothetical protein
VAKFDRSLLVSHVWAMTPATRLVWITLRILADKRGIVDASTVALARAANVSILECESALMAFAEPDPNNRTSAHCGRLIKIDVRGFQLLHGEQD